MPSILLTAATDIFVIAGAAAVATAALNAEKSPFRTSCGAEYEDDSLLAPKANNAVGTPEPQQSPLQKDADAHLKAPLVTVNEVVVTPPLVEMQGDGFFPVTKAA